MAKSIGIFVSLQQNDDNKIYVAVDFGTRYSGYAYSSGKSIEGIKLNVNWRSNRGSEVRKIIEKVCFVYIPCMHLFIPETLSLRPKYVCISLLLP